MRSQINLGQVFGIRIGLHYSWFIIALLIVFSLSAQFHTSNPEWGDGVILALAVATAILFFISLLLHELAHSVVAKSRGLPVREITLFALGGVSQIEKEPTSATMEFWMAFVGPLTSAGIGLLCLALSRVSGAASSPATAMVSWLGYINLALAGFNMIPGYPLDGGRILRALIWWKTGDVERSTRMASRVGQAVALIFIGFGIPLSANMSETVTPWKFSVEGEAGSESDERIGTSPRWGGDRGGGKGDAAAVYGGIQAEDCPRGRRL